MIRLRQFLSLAALTTLEALRQPIVLLLTATCVVLTALVPLTVMHSFGEDGKLVRDGAFAFHFVFGLFVAGYSASSCLAREVRSGTASVVLSKPVGRNTFFLAKFTGVAAVILAFSACATLATLLGERVAEEFVFSRQMVGYFTDWQTGVLLLAATPVAFLVAGWVNYRTHRPFGSAALVFLLLCLLLVLFVSGFFDRVGRLSALDYRVEWRLTAVSALVTAALVVLAAFAVTFSTRLGTVPTLTLTSVVFLLGLRSDHLFGRRAAESLPATLLYRLVPNWQHFWMADALNAGGTVSTTYLLAALSYAALYSTGLLLVGMLLFQNTDLR